MEKINQKIVLFIEPNKRKYSTPSKIGNLFMNGFSVNEEASCEILKICQLENRLCDLEDGELTQEQGLDLILEKN